MSPDDFLAQQRTKAANEEAVNRHILQDILVGKVNLIVLGYVVNGLAFLICALHPLTDAGRYGMTAIVFAFGIAWISQFIQNLPPSLLKGNEAPIAKYALLLYAASVVGTAVALFCAAILLLT